MKIKYLFLSSWIMISCENQRILIIPVSVSQFKDFIEATDYKTDAEKFGWSIVQTNVFDFVVVDGATWFKPDGKNSAKSNYPVTQVSYNDAIEYCKWANLSLPSYEQYWELVAEDGRTIASEERLPISPINEVNVVGNVWDITSTLISDEVRLAGGSIFCSSTLCDGTNKDRELFVDRQTGNTNIGFSVIVK
tara:strand:- start:99 stop:674 length:576 start_codon:yes stop_codon:yes gene_type:complete